MILSALSLLMLLLVLAGLAAQDVVVGVNVVNPMRASVADQNAVLSQLEMAHVSETVPAGKAAHGETHGYQRLRSAGFVYSNTQPLYRCYSEAEHSHFASNREDCDNMGKREALLGYDLKE